MLLEHLLLQFLNLVLLLLLDKLIRFAVQVIVELARQTIKARIYVTPFLSLRQSAASLAVVWTTTPEARFCLPVSALSSFPRLYHSILTTNMPTE